MSTLNTHDVTVVLRPVWKELRRMMLWRHSYQAELQRTRMVRRWCTCATGQRGNQTTSWSVCWIGIESSQKRWRRPPTRCATTTSSSQYQSAGANTTDSPSALPRPAPLNFFVWNPLAASLYSYASYIDDCSLFLNALYIQLHLSICANKASKQPFFLTTNFKFTFFVVLIICKNKLLYESQFLAPYNEEYLYYKISRKQSQTNSLLILKFDAKKPGHSVHIPALPKYNFRV